MKVTIVPSGTALPEQSRTGSVSTTMFSFVRCATCMRRLPLHGSAATCCTTRRCETFPTDATNCVAPSLCPEEASIHAAPLRLVTVCVAPEPGSPARAVFDFARDGVDGPFTDKLKFTGVGWSTRL